MHKSVRSFLDQAPRLKRHQKTYLGLLLRRFLKHAAEPWQKDGSLNPELQSLRSIPALHPLSEVHTLSTVHSWAKALADDYDAEYFKLDSVEPFRLVLPWARRYDGVTRTHKATRMRCDIHPLRSSIWVFRDAPFSMNYNYLPGVLE